MVEGKSLLVPDLTPSAVCKGCHLRIRDKYLLRVHDGLWHESCVQCVTCREPLTHSCFLRDNKLYCRRDYTKLFAVRCKGCEEVISPAELVMLAGKAVYHLACFRCSACGLSLQRGDQCVLREGRLLCVADYHHQRPASPESSLSGKSEDDEDDEEEEEDEDSSSKATSEQNRSGSLDHKRPKRPRTILTTQQRRAFKASFEVSSKPCRKVRETLAAETGLSVRVVQVWFQNQRAKMKKLARRQQQQQQQQLSPQDTHDGPGLHTVPPCGMTSDLEGLASFSSLPPQQTIAMETQGFKMDHFRQGLTPPQMPGDHMHPYGCEPLYSEMDGDSLCHLGDCLSSSDPTLLTPIDRLYSMQESYFTS
ncbi:LIM homeobox transcription factor 1-alpha [Sardina pilchardus]|uniref:LIM homeobox transcription factor 1-alpha n=1 Tax=Sardina pilchardus TaxID=27697 RepID=UPI002E109125